MYWVFKKVEEDEEKEKQKYLEQEERRALKNHQTEGEVNNMPSLEIGTSMRKGEP